MRGHYSYNCYFLLSTDKIITCHKAVSILHKYIYMWYDVIYISVVYDYTRKHPSVSREPPEQYGRKYLRKAVVHFSIFLRSSPAAPISPFHSARPHRRIRRETGIASYFPEGRWVNSTSQNRDHRSVQKQMYGDHLLSWSDGCRRGSRGWEGWWLRRIPISTKYEIWKVSSAKYHCRSAGARVLLRRIRNGTMYKMLIKFFIAA